MGVPEYGHRPLKYCRERSLRAHSSHIRIALHLVVTRQQSARTDFWTFGTKHPRSQTHPSRQKPRKYYTGRQGSIHSASEQLATS
ncbi:hypothetical protein AB1N83_012763 [Pleurotus pulmonarius]